MVRSLRRESAIAARVPTLALALAPALVLAACEVDDRRGDDRGEPLGRAAEPMTVGQAIGSSCSTTSVKGLSDQIIAQANCAHPGAFTLVPDLPNVTMASTVFPYLEKPARDAFVSAANAHPTTSLGVNSMLRTIAQQYLLYTWYQNGQCGIGLAAVPGNSNHETGLAFDTSDAAAWKSALSAVGFKYFGAADPVHFDYVGAGAVDERGADVLAFQVLWNENHPDDLIAEDGVWGPATAARMDASPADGFPIGPDCGSTAAGPDVALAVDVSGASDRFPDGASMGVPDLFEADHASIAVTLKNVGGAAANVTLGIEIDPAWSADDWLIESDWMNGGVFQTNEANTAPTNPAHGPLPAQAKLDLHQLSPGESKRVTLPVTALSYSVGAPGSPSVRFFVADIPGVYSQASYGGAVSNPKDPQSWNGGRLEIAQKGDIYSRTHWEWGSDRLEGFQASPGATIAVKDGALELASATPGAYAASPDTGFDAASARYVVLRAKRDGGTGDARLAYWTEPGADPKTATSVALDLPADGAFHEVTVDMSAAPGFGGLVHGLALVGFTTSGGTLDVDYLRVGDAPGSEPVTTPSDPAEEARAGSCACSFGDEAKDGPRAVLVVLAASAIVASGARRRTRIRRRAM